jgi:hypothetical protein
MRIKVARKQGRQAARTNHVRNQPGDPFKAATRRVAIPSPGNVRELEAVAPAFITWYVQHPFSADIEEVLESLTRFFRFYPELKGTRAITALEPAEVTAKLTSLMTHALLEGVMATYSLMRFLDFLHDSGRWSGSQEAFQTMHGILEDIGCSEVRVMIRHRPIPDHFTTGTAE